MNNHIKNIGNYTHSIGTSGFYDAEIKTSILATLLWYSNISMDAVTVTVKHGFVNILGMVAWKYQKMLISGIVQKINGVKGITNTICVANELSFYH